MYVCVCVCVCVERELPDSSVDKESTCNSEDPGFNFLGWEDPLKKE